MTRAQLAKLLKMDPIRARGVLFQIAAILYPTPDHEWSADTLDAIARALDEVLKYERKG